jgi:hypothetical protein
MSRHRLTFIISDIALIVTATVLVWSLFAYADLIFQR